MDKFNVQEIASEIMKSFVRNEEGELAANLTITEDPIDYMPIWSYSISLSIDAKVKKSFDFYEIGDGIGLKERHMHHMQMIIYLTDYLARFSEGYLQVINCKLTKSIRMDMSLEGLCIPSGFKVNWLRV